MPVHSQLVLGRVRQIVNHLGGPRTLGLLRMPVRGLSVSVEDSVVVKESGGFAEVLLNRPSKLNALNLDMVRELSPFYKKWLGGESEVKVVFMHGSGEKAFCAGGDVASVREELLSGGSLPADFFYEEYQLNHKIATAYENRSIVQVSVWDGVTMGGGVGLSLHGKIRVATERTLFAMPECGIGLFPDVGGTFALSRLSSSPAIGLYMALTGCRLGAADCMYSGLTTHYVHSNSLPHLQSELKALESPSLEDVLGVLAKVGGSASPEGESKLSKLSGSIEECFNASTMEEVVGALEKHTMNKEWAESTLKKLLSLSPKSLKVTVAAINRHKEASVDIGSALKNEYRLSQRFMQLQPQSDFSEGIRAILVDKDHKPKWNPSSLQQVSEEEVSAFFEPLPAEHSRGELQLV